MSDYASDYAGKPGDWVIGPDGARSRMTPIWSADLIRERLAQVEAGTAPELRLIVIEKYAPVNTEGWVYRVTKVNKTTVSLEPLAGARRGLRIDAITLAEADDDDVEAYLAKAKAPTATKLWLGSVVTVGGPRWGEPVGTLYVVIAFKGLTEAKVAKLGGDNGRFWGPLPLEYLTAVEPERLTVSLGGDA
jgi:hypothetical protein